MKHLRFETDNSITIESLDDYVPSVSMEGFIDTLRQKFRDIKAKFNINSNDAEQQIKKNQEAISEFRRLLVNFKSDLSKRNEDVKRSVDLTNVLDKLGIKASNSQELLRGLKTKHNELKKKLNEVDDLLNETKSALKANDADTAQQLKEKLKSIKTDIKDIEKVENSGKIELSRKDMISLSDIMIDFCDLFTEAVKNKKLLSTVEELMSLHDKIPSMESRDGGFFDGVIWLAKNIVMLIIYTFVAIIVFNISMFILAANPFAFMVSMLVLGAIYALRDTDDPRLKERDKKHS